MTPTEALAALLADDTAHIGTVRGERVYTEETLRATFADVVPPGRCGAPAPLDDALICELLAGHAGMHQARQYPVGIASAGFVTYWHVGPA